VLEKNQKNEAALYEKGSILIKLGKFVEAIECLNDLQKIKPLLEGI